MEVIKSVKKVACVALASVTLMMSVPVANLVGIKLESPFSISADAAFWECIYTIKYAAGGGSGSMKNQSVKKNKSFKVRNNSFKRNGYAFQGWNVQRKSDGKWYVSGKGWLSSKEISSKKLTKKLYSQGQNLKMDSSWQKGSEFRESFTFHAVWSAVAPALKVNWNFSDVTSLSTNDAQIKVNVGFEKSVYVEKTGFYIGKSQTSLKKNSIPDVVKKSYKSLPVWFLMSKYKEKLEPATTYYYKFYVIVGGKEYSSPVKSFKTLAVSTFNTKVNELKKMYPQGTPWGNNKRANGGSGCYAFAATCLKYVKGRLPGGPINNKKFKDIKVGDMVHYRTSEGGQHWVFVIAKDSNSITVAEGNYSDKVNWGRKISKSFLDKNMFSSDSLRR